MAEPTRKDFEAVARILAEYDVSKEMVKDFEKYFARRNPRFNPRLFEDFIEDLKKKKLEEEVL